MYSQISHGSNSYNIHKGEKLDYTSGISSKESETVPKMNYMNGGKSLDSKLTIRWSKHSENLKKSRNYWNFSNFQDENLYHTN